jgi:hypothetical protein
MALFTRFANDGNLHTFRSSDDGMSIRNCGGEDTSTGTNEGTMQSIIGSSSSSGTSQGPNGKAKDTTPTTTLCKRCRDSKAVCIVREECLCQMCALVYISGKCRKALTEPVTIGRDVLLAVGGGDASIAAMHNISLLMDCGKRRRRFLKDAAIVYVDTSSVYPSDEQRYDRVLFITRLALSLGLHIYIVPIETFFMDKLHILPIAASIIENDSNSVLLVDNNKGMGPLKEELSTTNVSSTVIPSSDPTVTGTPSPDETVSRESQRKNKKKEKKNQFTDSILTDTFVPYRVTRSYIDQQIHTLQTILQSLHSSIPSPSPLSTSFTKAVEHLRNCIGKCSGTDQKQELMDIIIHHLIYRTTNALKFSCLITCDSADRMAQRIMLTTFSGEGFSLPMDVAMIDTRFYAFLSPNIPYFSSSSITTPAVSLLPSHSSDADASNGIRLPSNWYGTTAGTEKPEPFTLPDEDQQQLQSILQRTPSGPVPDERGGFYILRPFAEMEQKEFAIYRRYIRHILDTTTPINAQPSSFTAAVLPRTSIANTTQGVLFGLQISFPSTVHNVVRTVRKLRIPSFAKSSSSHQQYITGLCELCYGLLPSTVNDTVSTTSSTNHHHLCFRCQRLHKENSLILTSKI